ncbi:hypothetical protein ACOME3_003393 [Neoechinorhynchus agilis]
MEFASSQLQKQREHPNMDPRALSTLKSQLGKFAALVKECRTNLTKDQQVQGLRFARFTDFRFNIKRLCAGIGETVLLERCENLKSILDDPLAEALYMQLYYQRFFDVCANKELTVELDVYVQCLTNMSDIFQFFKTPERSIDLPASWLWAILDEFTIAFEGMMWDLRKGEPNENTQEYEEFASPYYVLNPLYEFMKTCRYDQMIEALRKNEPFVGSALYRALGFYSAVCLMRFHACDADYPSALNIVDQLAATDKDKLMLSGGQWHCVFTTDYYRSFCLLMGRRYMDAIKVCTSSLTNILQTRETATKVGSASTALSAPIAFLRSKLCYILALALAFFPYEVDDKVMDEVKSVVAHEILIGLLNGERTAFSRSFLQAAPRFCSFDPNCTAQQVLEDQAQVFMMEVDEQLLFMQIRKRLSAYMSIPVARLAELINKPVDTTLDLLMSLKHKISLPCGIISDLGRHTAVIYRSSSSLDYYISNGMIYVSHTEQKEKYATLFSEQLLVLKKLAFERSKYNQCDAARI